MPATQGATVAAAATGEATIVAHESSDASSASAAQHAQLQFFSSWFCPYAQRAWLALEESGCPYTWREIQPYLLDADTGEPTKNPKPIEQKRAEFPEFVACSPGGLVPALLLEQPADADADAPPTRVHESLICVEHIDARYAGGALMSASPDVRHGIAAAEESVLPSFYRLLMEQGHDSREAAAREICDGLLRWAAARPAGAAERGPFFLGETFSAADIALCPWWPQRLEWIAGSYRGFSLPSGPEFEPLRRFAQAVQARPSVQRTVVSRERLIRNYSGYVRTTATTAPSHSPSPHREPCPNQESVWMSVWM